MATLDTKFIDVVDIEFQETSTKKRSMLYFWIAMGVVCFGLACLLIPIFIDLGMKSTSDEKELSFTQVFDLNFHNETSLWKDKMGKEMIEMKKNLPIMLTNKTNDVHLSISFPGRKLFFIQVSLSSSSTEGSISLVPTSFRNESKGEIFLFKTASNSPMLVPFITHPCSSESIYPKKTLPWRRNIVRIALLIDNIPAQDQKSSGQWIHWIYNPPKYLFDEKYSKKNKVQYKDLFESKTVGRKSFSIYHNKEKLWGKNRTEVDISTCSSSSSVNKTENESLPCGWPFFQGLMWRMQTKSGHMKLESLKVYSVDGDSSSICTLNSFK